MVTFDIFTMRNRAQYIITTFRTIITPPIIRMPGPSPLAMYLSMPSFKNQGLNSSTPMVTAISSRVIVTAGIWGLRYPKRRPMVRKLISSFITSSSRKLLMGMLFSSKMSQPQFVPARPA